MTTAIYEARFVSISKLVKMTASDTSKLETIANHVSGNAAVHSLFDKGAANDNAPKKEKNYDVYSPLKEASQKRTEYDGLGASLAPYSSADINKAA